MGLYWQLARRGFRRYATYRGATVGGVFTNTVFGFMRAYVFIALFEAAGRVGGFDLKDALTFTFVTQGMLMTIYLWGWWDIALTIRSGDIVTDLYRPIDYQFYWLFQDLGRAAYHFVFRGIPPFVVGLVAFDLEVPATPLLWGAFLVSLILAVCVSFGLRFMINLSAFWLLDYRGVGNILAAAWTFLAGFLVPVAFFPAAWREVIYLLPFASTLQVPVDIFLGNARGAELAGALALQLAWGAVILTVGRSLLGAAMRRLVTQGG